MKKNTILKWSRTYKVLKYIYKQSWKWFFELDNHYFNRFRLCFLLWIPYIKYSEEVLWILYKKWFLFKSIYHNWFTYNLSQKWRHFCENIFTK